MSRFRSEGGWEIGCCHALRVYTCDGLQEKCCLAVIVT
jgi:hypothetical protein